MDTISSSFESHYLQLHILYHKLSENIMTIMNEVCNTCPYEKKNPAVYNFETLLGKTTSYPLDL